MASCSFIATGRTFKLEVVEIGYSVANNTSDIEWTLSISGGGSTWYDSYARATVNEQVVFNETKSWNTGTFPAKDGSVSGTITGIKHDNEGHKTISFALEGYSEVYTTQYANGTLKLTDIARASTISCSSVNIGETATIVVDTKNSSFTNNITYEIGSLTGTIKENATIDDKVLQLPTNTMVDDIYAQMPNDKEIDCKLYCTTYNGETPIGDVQVAPFKLYAVEKDCKPIVEANVIDTNQATINVTGSENIIVRHISKPKVTINATPRKSTTIESYSINLNDGQASTEAEYTFDTINSSMITVNAIDNRGYGDPKQIDLSDRFIDYVKLHINTISVTRPEGTSNEAILNANGAYFNGNFGSGTNLLPDEYQQVKYIQSEGNQYIDTGIVPNQNTSIEFDLGIVDYNNNASFSYGGSVSYGSSAFEAYPWNALLQVNYGSQSIFHSVPIANDHRYLIVQNKNYSKVTDKTTNQSSEYTFAETEFTSPKTLCLFALNRSGSIFTAPAKNIIYYCKIWDNENLVREFVPCYRKIDGKTGLYDLVDGSFYEENETGAFINGPDIEGKANTLTAVFQYRVTGDEEWIDGGAISPTIENNSFKFENHSLGNIYDYNEEYQFKIILTDLLMEVGSSNKDIQTLETGQEVVAIGDKEVFVYGDLYLNDIPLGDFENADTLPIGAIVNYDGVNVPDGYEKINEKSYSEYAEEEQKIGKWTDGKDIYRRVILTTTPNNDVESTLVPLVNIDTIINIRGITINSVGAQVPVPYYFGHYGTIWYDAGYIYGVFTNGAYQNKPITIICEYTKTTDVEV